MLLIYDDSKHIWIFYRFVRVEEVVDDVVYWKAHANAGMNRPIIRYNIKWNTEFWCELMQITGLSCVTNSNIFGIKDGLHQYKNHSQSIISLVKN